mmetsp:Transcript_20559/g.55383  ORF Transcript_20559/g.55383 Transcript_20559/m.55383 type:complete len:284 (-) Transcript_20559:465-1316(-)
MQEGEDLPTCAASASPQSASSAHGAPFAHAALRCCAVADTGEAAHRSERRLHVCVRRTATSTSIATTASSAAVATDAMASGLFVATPGESCCAKLPGAPVANSTAPSVASQRCVPSRTSKPSSSSTARTSARDGPPSRWPPWPSSSSPLPCSGQLLSGLVTRRRGPSDTSSGQPGASARERDWMYRYHGWKSSMPGIVARKCVCELKRTPPDLELRLRRVASCAAVLPVSASPPPPPRHSASAACTRPLPTMESTLVPSIACISRRRSAWACRAASAMSSHSC